MWSCTSSRSACTGTNSWYQGRLKRSDFWYLPSLNTYCLCLIIWPVVFFYRYLHLSMAPQTCVSEPRVFLFSDFLRKVSAEGSAYWGLSTRTIKACIPAGNAVDLTMAMSQRHRTVQTLDRVCPLIGVAFPYSDNVASRSMSKDTLMH